MAGRSKINKYELFEEKVDEIKFTWPAVIIFKNGSIEAFNENGTWIHIRAEEGSVFFSKGKINTKVNPVAQNQDPKYHYEWYIKRLALTHSFGTIEDFNAVYERYNKVCDELDLLSFEHSFEAAGETNIDGLVKKIIPIVETIQSSDPTIIINDGKIKEEDHPF